MKVDRPHHDAEAGNVTIRAADGTTRHALKDAVQLATGDRVRIDTGGVGGYGDPRRRDRASLREDIEKGYVPVEAARRIYGWEERWRGATVRRPRSVPCSSGKHFRSRTSTCR